MDGINFSVIGVQSLGAFPHSDLPAPALPRGLARRGLALRRATTQDLPFLRALFASFRAEEMASVPWPEEAKARFLDNQFALQHQYFVTRFPGADFLIVEADGQPAGRLYLDRGPEEHRVIDIGFLAARRGKGVGRDLLEWVIAEARSAGARRVALSVNLTNPRARKLYESLGFVAGMAQGASLAMSRELS